MSRRDTLELFALAVGGDWTGGASLADDDRDRDPATDGGEDAGEPDNDLP